MAKILLGPTVIGIRGTVAGITFSQNRGGPYARGWHTPPNPRAANQRLQQNRLGNNAVAWRSLTAAQQATWIAYAALPAQTLTDSLGQPYFANGCNWYVSCTLRLAQIGAAPIVTAPVGVRPVAPVITAAAFRTTAAAFETVIQYAVGDPGLALYHACYCTIVQSQGVSIQPATLYFMLAQIPNAARINFFKTESQTKFGTTAITQKMFMASQVLSAEGQASAPAFIAKNAQNP